MDQIVTRPRGEPAAPRKAEAPDVAAALRLDRKGRSRRRRWPYALAFLVAAAGVAAGSYFYVGQPSQRIAYATVAAARSDLTVEVSATGNLQPLTKVDISSELSGVVRSVQVAENQRVQAGAVLAELDKTRLSAQVERGEASVDAARARVTDAQTTLGETEKALARAEQLAQRGMTTDQALETATAARDRAASAVAIAEANLAIAVAELKLQQADLEKSTIYAPIDGIVLTRSVDPGQTVASSLQAPVLFVIAAELENMELKAAIDEADIGSVKPGQKAIFTVDAFPDRKFDAEIRDIAYASVTTEGVVTYDARLGVDNAELLLRPGMTATVSVVTREAKDVITVPAAAFRFRPPAAQPRSGWSLQNLFMPRLPRSGGQRAAAVSTDGTRTLYVLREGQPAPVKVKTGSTDGERTEIVSGLDVGDLVVTGTTTTAN
ncbi:MAG: efflux RND transporter periplasmic adaptor subunit [Rhizobiaceae bacterium]|nr:MAG: efflux RND transporter periplasmic adaptor subunit [Rhizobiaceae bacterium]CAG0953041.1 Macrolide export protein MacA [Rhizobiaceae bacterium]